MNVVLIGATGMVGSRIRDELLRRNHRVTAPVRSPEKLTSSAQLTVVKGDVFDTAGLTEMFRGKDAVVHAYKPSREHPDRIGEQRRAIASVIEALGESRTKRIVATGGAGSLFYRPGVKFIDSPEFPKDWAVGAVATAEIPRALAQHPELDWTIIHPPSSIAPGTRTGKLRVGTDFVIFNEKGESGISAEDYAVALVDELEDPRHVRGCFTVAN